MGHGKENDQYALRDLHLAAVIYAKGVKFIRLEPDGNRFLFLFENRVACEKVASSYFRGDCLVKAKAMADAIRTLKDLVFSKK